MKTETSAEKPSKRLQRGLVGGVAGTLIALTGGALVLAAIGYIPEDGTLGAIIAGSGFILGATAGSTAGGWELRGRFKDTVVGILAGVVAGVVAAIIYAFIAASIESHGIMFEKMEAGYRNQAMLIGIPIGAVLGGVGGLLFGTRRLNRKQVSHHP